MKYSITGKEMVSS